MAKNKRDWAEINGRKGKRFVERDVKQDHTAKSAGSRGDRAGSADRRRSGNAKVNRQAKSSNGREGWEDCTEHANRADRAAYKKSADRQAKTANRNEHSNFDRRGQSHGYGEEWELPSNAILGRNPVMEALRNDREMEKLLVGKGAEGSITKIIAMAKEKGIPIYQSDKMTLDRIAAGGPHQGVIAYASAYSYSTMEDIYAKAEASGQPPLVVILDNLEDPHNLGAIMRTAECAGAHGVIIPKRRSVGLTDTVAKSSAGAIEYMPCVKVANIGQTIDQLKEDGFWVAACDMGGSEYYKQDLTGKLAIVIGSEGAGISQLVKKKCDFTVSMPMVGRITSLNASNAAAVLMYEVRRQRDGRK